MVNSSVKYADAATGTAGVQLRKSGENVGCRKRTSRPAIRRRLPAWRRQWPARVLAAEVASASSFMSRAATAKAAPSIVTISWARWIAHKAKSLRLLISVVSTTALLIALGVELYSGCGPERQSLNNHNLRLLCNAYTRFRHECLHIIVLLLASLHAGWGGAANGSREEIDVYSEEARARRGHRYRCCLRRRSRPG